jgi:glucosamine-6-phosphate deaminase
VSVFADPQAAAQALADRITAAIASKPTMVLGLPTGRTPIPFYDELSTRAARGAVDFSRVTTFNLDEFVGIPATHSGSFRHFMNVHLFTRVNLAPERIHFLDGTTEDAGRECARYEEDIASAGGIDIQLLGLGTNGHIGFNEPAETLHANTHRVTLEPATRRDNAGLFGGDPSAVPGEALSIGIGTILRARSIVLLATGVSKASVVRRMLKEGVTTMLPASFLQVHSNVEIVLDEAAASELSST